MDAISVFFASEKGKRHTLVVAIDQSKDFLLEVCYQIVVGGNVVEVKPVRKNMVRFVHHVAKVGQDEPVFSSLCVVGLAGT
jgi:hypothetical protein